MLGFIDIQLMLFLAPPLLLSLVVHEVAHARTAYAFGDPTAKTLGRCSFNPLVHLDPIGTIALFLVHFGWAKPVPVNPANLEPRRLGYIMVSLAGPLSNLTLAAIFGLIIRFGLPHMRWLDNDWYYTAYSIFSLTVVINIILFTFNLIPLFPLDGHHIVRELLPWRKQQAFMQWQVRYGQPVLLGLIFVPQLLSMAAPQMEVIHPIRIFFNFILDNALPFFGI